MPIGTPIAAIGEGAEVPRAQPRAAAESRGGRKRAATEAGGGAQATATETEAPAAAVQRRLPAGRRPGRRALPRLAVGEALAAEHGIDLSRIAGTGPGGPHRERDELAALLTGAAPRTERGGRRRAAPEQPRRPAAGLPAGPPARADRGAGDAAREPTRMMQVTAGGWRSRSRTPRTSMSPSKSTWRRAALREQINAQLRERPRSPSTTS